MRDPLDVIEEALVRKGISAAAASRLAFGHGSAIANMRASRSKDGTFRPSLPVLEGLADVLDLEIYFGPRREPHVTSEPTQTGSGHPVSGAAEEGRAFDPPPSWQMTPIPWHSRFRRAGTAPVRLDSDWIRNHLKIGVHRLAFAEVDLPGNWPFASSNALVLLDRQAERTGTGAWAWNDNGSTRAGRMAFPSPNQVFAADFDFSRPARQAHIAELEPLGRIVWVAAAAYEEKRGEDSL